MACCPRVADPLVLAAWLALLAACTDQPPTSPRAAAPEARANLLLTGDDPPAPPGGLSGTLSPTSSWENAGPVALGSYGEGTWVEIKVSGLLDRYYGTTQNWPENLRGQFKDN